MDARRPSVFLTRRWPTEAETRLANAYQLTRNIEDHPLDSHAIGEALCNFDFVCPTITDRIDAEMLARPGIKVQALCNFGAGTGHIDLAACKAAGILVTNTPDVLTDDTADLTMMLALMCARRAGEGERDVRNDKWSGWAPTHLLGTRLSGKTFGVIGFGRIGQAAARRAHFGFNMRIIYASRNSIPESVERELKADRMTIDELMGEADVVSLHVPASQKTVGLIGASQIARMKGSGIIINTARGEIIDEVALGEALANGRIKAAGLDVFRNEPRVSPFLKALENVVLLPHLGSATVETRVAMGLRVKENIDAIASAKPPLDRVL